MDKDYKTILILAFIAIVLTGLLFLLSMASCKKIDFNEVKADFEIIGQSVENEITYFVNKSDFADSYEWNFDDGTISNKRNPEKIFIKQGKYSVTLKAFNGKRTDVITKDIIVYLYAE